MTAARTEDEADGAAVEPRTQSLEVRRATRDDAPAIEAWAVTAGRASFFHRPAWTRAVEAQFRHEDRSLVALRGGDVVGALPLSMCRGLRGGRDLVSTPYGVYGGPAGDDAQVERALFAAAEADATALGVGRLELRCLEPPAFELPTADLHATFIKDLPDDPADVLPGMPKKARADARKARKSHGLTLHEGRWYVADLTRLFHRNKRSLGSPALPDTWFARLLDELGENATVHAVKRDGETLAAVMSFLFRDQVLAYYSGTGEGVDRAFKASSFMYMALQEWSVDRGYRVFDFGRSRKGSGAFSFKEHQGFEATDLHYSFRLVRAKGLPTFNPSNPRTEVLQRTWRRLPLGVTARLSGPLARYLP